MNRIKLILITFVLIASISVASAGTDVGGEITTDTTWYKIDTPHTVTDNVVVYHGATLTIEPGVTVNFEEGTRLQIGKIIALHRSGKLVADGTSEKITFTGTTKAPGHWNGTIFAPASDDASVINNTIIEYGGHEFWCEGGYRYANIMTCCAAPTITNNTIRNSAGDGILCIGPCSTPTITCNWITNNTNGVHTIALAKPTINYNNICGNFVYGVLNNRLVGAPPWVDAENNWWGDSNGPGGVGPGNGDAVSNKVYYDPWEGQPVPCAPIPELSSIILVAAGLLMLAGYVRIGRRD